MGSLIPFVFTAKQNLDVLALGDIERAGLEAELFLVDEPESRDFGLIMNYTNQLAFGGETNMGMPLWVLLDCGILPSAVVGFGLCREDVSDELAAELKVPDDYDGLVPVSEYCACPTLEPGCVSGFSLQAQLTGMGLGTRTKALALAVYGARSQVGVTQFDNPSIRVHSKFGVMKITATRPSIHTHAMNSFVYRLELPARDVLLAMAGGDFSSTKQIEAPAGQAWSFDPSSEADHARLAGLISDRQPVYIIPPGWRAVGDGCRLELIVGH